MTHRFGQLFQAGGGLLQTGRGALRTGRQVLVALRNLGTGGLDLYAGLANVAHDAPQRDQHRIRAAQQVPDFVAALHVERLFDVSLRKSRVHILQGAQRLHYRAGDPPRGQQPQQQRHDRQPRHDPYRGGDGLRRLLGVSIGQIGLELDQLSLGALICAQRGQQLAVNQLLRQLDSTGGQRIERLLTSIDVGLAHGAELL